MLTWWFGLIILILVTAWALVYHKIKLKALRNEKAEMERKMLEKSELLVHIKSIEKKAREEADMANRSKSILLSKITHEIRTPMNAMMGMASLINETNLNAEQQKFTASILQSGDGLISLINDILMQDILEYSKIDSGKELEFKEFDLRNSIEEVLDVFGSKAVAAGVDLVYNIDDNVSCNLIGDGYRLRQVLMNLIENSFRFTSSGEIVVGVDFLRATKDGRLHIEFEVKDTGRGMLPERLEKVSKELLSSDKPEASNKVLGLTLIICKKLVALMGGTLRVESNKSGGTTFKFDISVQPGLQPKRSHLHAEMAASKGRKVLIIDDNATVLNHLKNELTSWKLDAHVTTSPNKALEILKNHSDFDLVITDLQMPHMDGIILSKAIKKLSPSIPIILLNDVGDESFRQYPDLFSSHINKPVKQHLLSNFVFSALRQKVNSETHHKQKQKLSADFAKQNPLHILVGEDDAMNQMVVKTVLGKLGYTVNICKNGQEVLEEVSHRRYDLILMDVQMPQMDGLEATRMIRLCLTEQPVIIAMTANTLQGDREVCLAAGMDDYIGKPVKLEEMVDLLEKWSLQVKQYHNN